MEKRANEKRREQVRKKRASKKKRGKRKRKISCVAPKQSGGLQKHEQA